jgi:hypothetical protein
MASAIKKVLNKVAPTTHSPTSSTHDGEGLVSPTSPTRSRSPLGPDTPSHTSSALSDTDSTQQREGRKGNRVSTLLSHIRSHSSKRPDGEPVLQQNGHLPNGAAVTINNEHGDTVHSHEIVRPSTQRRLSMTEEKEQRKANREEKEDQEAEQRRRRHLETWKNVRRFLLPPFCARLLTFSSFLFRTPYVIAGATCP